MRCNKCQKVSVGELFFRSDNFGLPQMFLVSLIPSNVTKNVFAIIIEFDERTSILWQSTILQQTWSWV